MTRDEEEMAKVWKKREKIGNLEVDKMCCSWRLQEQEEEGGGKGS